MIFEIKTARCYSLCIELMSFACVQYSYFTGLKTMCPFIQVNKVLYKHPYLQQQGRLQMPTFHAHSLQSCKIGILDTSKIYQINKLPVTPGCFYFKNLVFWCFWCFWPPFFGGGQCADRPSEASEAKLRSNFLILLQKK